MMLSRGSKGSLPSPSRARCRAQVPGINCNRPIAPADDTAPITARALGAHHGIDPAFGQAEALRGFHRHVQQCRRHAAAPVRQQLAHRQARFRAGRVPPERGRRAEQSTRMAQPAASRLVGRDQTRTWLCHRRWNRLARSGWTNARIVDLDRDIVAGLLANMLPACTDLARLVVRSGNHPEVGRILAVRWVLPERGQDRCRASACADARQSRHRRQ
jgi:hypothetical protein